MKATAALLPECPSYSEALAPPRGLAFVTCCAGGRRHMRRCDGSFSKGHLCKVPAALFGVSGRRRPLHASDAHARAVRRADQGIDHQGHGRCGGSRMRFACACTRITCAGTRVKSDLCTRTSTCACMLTHRKVSAGSASLMPGGAQFRHLCCWVWVENCRSRVTAVPLLS
eukprot:6184783-Pleurochrysis_carterae.AAC.2